MRTEPLDAKTATANRKRLARLLPAKSVAILNANDIFPINADGTFSLRANSDLFHLSGIEQEETILLLFPDANDARFREVLFIRESKPEHELWEGHKLTCEEGRQISGVQQVQFVTDFDATLHRIICEAEHVYLNTNEHRRANADVPTRDDRFISEIRKRYQLHEFCRLAPLMHAIRLVKLQGEVALIKKACALTGSGFKRVLKMIRPGVNERAVEAELAHEFIRGHGRFAYDPIVASGANACILHYTENSMEMKDGDLVLLDVASSFANYNSDLTRTVPVNGRFTKRQRDVYDAVLRVLKHSTKQLKPGLKISRWQAEAEAMMTEELLKLRLLKTGDIKKTKSGVSPAKKYFMHGLGHPIGLDVHDVGDTSKPIKAGWVMTVEPGIYIPEEKMGIRLENTVLVTEKGPRNLMADIPLEATEIEDWMKR